MKPSERTRVKVCCISSVEEAAAAVERGASALGLVSEMPSGPGVISGNLIAEIAASVPPSVATFLLTSKSSSNEIIQQLKTARTNTVQIVDELKEGSYEEIRDKIPGIKIVQVIHVAGEQSVSAAVQVSRFVDAVLLDSGNPNLKIKELGGTGRVHNWDVSRAIREALDIPVFLAGGLNPGNVREAIEKVKPFGVDLCSGVRTGGRLDPVKLDAFFSEVEKTF